MNMKKSAGRGARNQAVSNGRGERAPSPARAGSAPSRSRSRPAPRRNVRRRVWLRPWWMFLGAVALIAVVIIGLIVYNQASQAPQNGLSGQYPYAVGSPGQGAAAPAIKLTATDGSSFDLAAWRGKTVLLYFQEGVGCQPCWDQLKEIEGKFGDFKALGIDQVVTITGDPLDALRQKSALEHLTTPVLSDAGLAVSVTYHANQYGMMGAGADGHTFIVVGPDGRIRWRADYGGAPKYTMYLPVSNLLADMRAGTKPS
jgi:peroxiredoxin